MPVLNLHGKNVLMKIAHNYYTAALVSLALANGLLSSRVLGRAAEPPPANAAERIRVLEAEEHGLQPIGPPHLFGASIFAETAKAGLVVKSCSKVSSKTNGALAELRQSLAVESTERQLLDFLGNLAATNSSLRAQSLSLRPTPDRTRLVATLAIAGVYRLAAKDQTSQVKDADVALGEFLVLSRRHQLRRAALDCYNVVKSTLPPGWDLDSLSLDDGKRLKAQGVAPAGQAGLLPDIQAKFEQAQSPDGKDLFVPASGQSSMRLRKRLQSPRRCVS